MKNYFKPKPKLNTLEQNKINGKSAERYFAAMLTMALESGLRELKMILKLI